MKRSRFNTYSVSILGMLMLSIGIYADAPVAHSYESRVAITGIILPQGHESEEGAYTLRIKNEKWVFKMTNSSAVNGYHSSTHGLPLFNAVGFNQMRLMGSDEALEALRSENMTCRGLHIKGHFYKHTGTLYVATVEEVPPEMKHPTCI